MSSTAAAEALERRTMTIILLENSLYGGFFVLYSISNLLHYQRRCRLEKQAKDGFGGFGGGGSLDSADKERLRTMRFWEITGTLMFVVVTVHWMLAWVMYVGSPPEMRARLIQFSRVLLAEITILIGDLIIIHRLWMVGNKSKIIIAFPLLALTSFFTFAIPLSWEYYLVYARKNIPILLRKNYWIMGVVVSTLSVNIYCTVLMSWKIWRANSGARRYGGGQLMHVVAILVESAAVYSLWMISVVGLVGAAHPLYIDFYDIATELYGVSTMLISVRVGLGWATGEGGRTIGAESEYARASTRMPATISEPGQVITPESGSPEPGDKKGGKQSDDIIV